VAFRLNARVVANFARYAPHSLAGSVSARFLPEADPPHDPRVRCAQRGAVFITRRQFHRNRALTLPASEENEDKYKKSGAARTWARSTTFEQKNLPLRASTLAEAGGGWVGCGFDPRKPGFLSAARCRAPLVCPGVRRAHGASVHFHDREPQRRGPLRCPADLYDARFATSGIHARQHWSRLALVSSQTVRRLPHTSNTQHAASIARAALAQATLAEKQTRDLV